MATDIVSSYVEAEFEDGSRIMRADASFDKAAEALANHEKYPARIIEVADLASRRMQFPKEHSLNQSGSYTHPDFLYAKRAEGLLVLDGPLSTDKDLVQQATEANKDERYFTTPKKDLYDKFEAIANVDAKDRAPEERRVLILPSRTQFPISQTQNPEFSKGLFRDLLTKNEGSYLIFTGKPKLMVYPFPISEIDSQAGTLVTKCWLQSLLGGSGVGGVDGGLGCGDRVRGVFVPGEASAQKILSLEEPLEMRDYIEEELAKVYSLIEKRKKEEALVALGRLKAMPLEKMLVGDDELIKNVNNSIRYFGSQLQ